VLIGGQQTFEKIHSIMDELLSPNLVTGEHNLFYLKATLIEPIRELLSRYKSEPEIKSMLRSLNNCDSAVENIRREREILKKLVEKIIDHYQVHTEIINTASDKIGIS